ncbi:vacuolar atpase assembly integral membrane protein vma21 [Lipomyces oligophaga]|uniref:vacuolar atpase assembly integral membrane protein vma21 n=1 Tax=Lipomyces oligophaga TaxID=45792 RepID=UPI0034CD9DC9
MSSSSKSTTIAPNMSVPKGVMSALIVFTVAMVVAPLSSFYIALNVLNFSRLWAGLSSALIANVVVLGYVLFAWNEDSSAFKDGEETKKSK